MRRRTFLTSVTAAVATGTLAGCLGGGDPSGGGGTDTESPANSPTETSPETTETPTDTATDAPTDTPTSVEGIASKTLEATGDCSNPDTANVAFESKTVVVTGCIQGPNGCHQPVLKRATMDGGKLNVVVTTEGQGDACTQALVQRSYEARISFDGDLPKTVVVIHDSMGEQSTVATAKR